MSEKKGDILDMYWAEYLRWCATMPDDTHELFSWLKLKDPTENNFWKWLVEHSNHGSNIGFEVSNDEQS